VLNSQLGSSVLATACANFTASVTEWRLMYAGLTMIQDGASLTDQGAMAACQFTMPIETYNLSYKNSQPKWVGVDHINCFYSDSVPTFNQTVNVLSCYQGPSKAGCYMPLKLTEDAMKWKSYRSTIRLGPDQHGYIYPNGQLPMPITGNTTTFPFYGFDAFYVSADGASVGGAILPPLDQSSVGVISWQNVSVNTSFTLHFRFGYEFRVRPGTSFSPLLTISPQYDPVALATYFEISRKLKDAYPSDFNSLGKLWTVIKSALKGASAIPGWPGLLASGVSAVGDIVENIVSDSSKVKPVKAPSINPTGKRVVVQQIVPVSRAKVKKPAKKTVKNSKRKKKIVWEAQD